MEPVDVGMVAEGFVAHLAYMAGILPHRVENDKKGWDYFLEISARGHTSTWFDVDPADIRCLVQVKGVRVGRKRSENVRLTNWEQFVKTPFGCFFIIVEIDHDDQPVDVFLVHVGEVWIGKVLKRLRLESARGTPRHTGPRMKGGKKKVKSLNQMMMSLTWGSQDRLAKPWHKNLREQIVATIADQHEYTNRKQSWYRTVGFEGPPYQIAVRFPNLSRNELFQQQADFAVGLADRISFESFESYETRFGIRRSVGRNDEGGYIQAGVQSIGDALVRITSADGITSTQLSCVVYHSSTYFPRLPVEHQKIRFVSPCSSIVVIGGKMVQCQFDLFNTGPQRLADIAGAAKALRIISAPDNGEMKFAFTIRGTTHEVGYRVHTPTDAAALENAQIVENAWRIARHFDIGNPTVEPLNLLTQRLQIALMRAALDPVSSPPLSLMTGFNSGSPIPDRDIRRIGFALCVTVALAEFVCLCSVAISGAPVWEGTGADTRVGVEDAPPEVIQTRVFAQQPSKETLRLMRSAATDALREQGTSDVIEL